MEHQIKGIVTVTHRGQAFAAFPRTLHDVEDLILWFQQVPSLNQFTSLILGLREIIMFDVDNDADHSLTVHTAQH